MILRPEHRETSPLSPLPVVLTIAGSDSSGGAGLQADLKTFTALGVYGTTAVTCVVAEHPGRVLHLTPLPPRRVAEQIQLILEAFPVAAIKTGLLHSAEIIRAVQLALAPALKKGVPLVIDPVMAASTGSGLLKKTALRALRAFLPSATLITPNRDELTLLSGRVIRSQDQLQEAALALARELGGPAILAKGGHFRSSLSTDFLILPGGSIQSYAAPRVKGANPHGTGCTYSAAITAYLGRGKSLPEATALGKKFITRAIQERWRVGPYDLLKIGPV